MSPCFGIPFVVRNQIFKLFWYKNFDCIDLVVDNTIFDYEKYRVTLRRNCLHCNFFRCSI